MKSSILLSALLTFAAAAPAAAQRDVTRRLYTFLDTDVTVEVLANIPGTLQIVRGEPGVIDVAARVPGGVSSSALGGRGDKLRLSAVGGERADFIVVVPEEAYVRVRLPNRKAGELASTRPSGSFAWGDAANTKASPIALPPAGPIVAYTAQRAPRLLSVPRLTTVRTISVRFEDMAFQVAGDHVMSVVNGSSQSAEIRTGNEPDNLIVVVPSDTRDFTLKLGGRTALVVRGIEITTYCEPVTEQVLPEGRRWLTFAPSAGRLMCR